MKTVSWTDRLIVGDRLAARLGPFALLAGLTALFAFGIVGVGRVYGWLDDFHYFYASGQSWLHGLNPYDSEQYVALWQSLFGREPRAPLSVYPPQAALLWMAFAWMEFGTAQILWSAFNLICLTLLAGLAVIFVYRAEMPRPASRYADAKWLLPALLLLVPPTWSGIWLGQPTPILVVLVMGAWLCARQRSDVLAGALLGLATFKPQFVLLVTLWFLLDRRWRLLLTEAVVSLLLALYAFIRIGPLDAIRDWLDVVSQYKAYDVALEGYANVLGIPSVLESAGLLGLGLAFWLSIACVLVILLYLRRHHFVADDILGILVGIHLSFTYGHLHEIIFLMPMVTAFWLHLRHRQGIWILGVAVALIAVPERVVRLAGSGYLMHWKTWVIFIGLVSLVLLSSGKKADASPR